MCSISVAPMPSIISMPVASFQSVRVAAGSTSPAETHLRSGAAVAHADASLARRRRPWRGTRSAR